MPESRVFKVANISFNAIRENKILAKISDFTVNRPVHEIEILMTYAYTYILSEVVIDETNNNKLRAT